MTEGELQSFDQNMDAGLATDNSKTSAQAAGGEFAIDMSGGDGCLLLNCAVHNRDHQNWVARLTDDAVNDPVARAELESLQKSWETALGCIETLMPRTVAGALAKAEVARRYVEWSRRDDGGAIELLDTVAKSLNILIGSHTNDNVCPAIGKAH